MKTRRIQDAGELTAKNFGNVQYTNFGATTDLSFWLPLIVAIPSGPLVLIGASQFSIAFESAEKGKILAADGMFSKCIIPAVNCVGSRTVITNLFGEAWHVSSNIPLIFE